MERLLPFCGCSVRRITPQQWCGPKAEPENPSLCGHATAQQSRAGLQAGDGLSHTKLVLAFDEACAYGARGTADLPVGILQAKAG